MSKFSPSMTEISEFLIKLALGRTEWTWNATHQKIFNKVKLIIKECTCIKFCDETIQLYIEFKVTSGVGLQFALLQTRSSTSSLRGEALDNSILRPIAFIRKSLSSVGKKDAAT